MKNNRHYLAIVSTVAVGVVALVAVPEVVKPYMLINGAIWSSLAVLSLSLALLWGFSGILCLGQAAFFGLGGYAYAVTMINSGSAGLGVLSAIAVPAVVAGALGYFMFWGRVSDVYLAVMTLTVSLIFQHFINQTGGEEWMIGSAPLGGFNGIPSVPPLSWPGLPDGALGPRAIYSVNALVLILAFIVCRGLLNARFGRLLVAARENETRIALLGYDARRYKEAIFVFSGGLAGLAGALFANASFVSPSMFSLNLSAQIVIWVIVGGRGTLIGPILGCFIVQALVGALGMLSHVPGGAWLDPNLILGVGLVLFVVLVPGGMVALFKRVISANAATGAFSPSERAPMHDNGRVA